MEIDNDVSTTSWLAQHINQSILSSSLNHDIISPSPNVDSVLSNGITENILSIIHEVGEAEDSSYDDVYLSDEESLVQWFIRIRIIPGVAFPSNWLCEQLHSSKQEILVYITISL